MILKNIQIISVVLVLTLTAAFVPKLVVTAATHKIQNTVCRGNIESINTSIKLRTAMQGRIPPLKEFLTDSFYFPEGVPTCPFGMPYVLDADLHVIPHNH